MRFIGNRNNPNALAGIFLLLLLAIFAGPNLLPDLLARSVPFIDEGVPCDRLRDGSLRDRNQSLIGREVSSREDPPYSLNLRVQRNSDSTVTFTVVVRNETLGTVPILVTNDQLIVNTTTDTTNGLGVIVGQQVAVPPPLENVGTYPAERIRLLAPRQRCVQRVTVSLDALTSPSVFTADNVTALAFYRNNIRGVLGGPYPDQGLWTGTVVSEPVQVSAG
jgi:hypothetical protein